MWSEKRSNDPMSQSARTVGTKPQLAHCRSSTFDEGTTIAPSPSPEPDAFVQSDTTQIHSWQTTNRPLVPHSVPSKPHVYKFSLTKRPEASSYRGHGHQYPEMSSQNGGSGMLARAETVGSGLGERGAQELEGSRPECGICLGEFSDEGLLVPRSLSCGHSYCTGCIDKLLLKSSATHPAVTCPKCSGKTEVKQHNPSTLPKNWGLIEVIQNSLRTGSTYLSSTVPPRMRSPSPARERERLPVVMKCEEHNGDNLSSFCTKCGELVCSSCLLYGKHRDHNSKTLFVNEAASMFRKKLCDFSPEIKHQRGKMEAALGEVDRMNDSVQEMGGRLTQEAEHVYGELIAMIEARRDELKLQIMERTQIRVEALTTQAMDLRECVEKASAVQHTTEQLLKSDDYTLLQSANLTMDEIEGLFTNPPACTPRAQNDLKCEFSNGPKEEIASNLSAFGSVRPDVGIINHLFIKPYHDGFSLQWDGHNFADNEGTTYYLQKAVGRDDEFSALSRCAATKYNYKAEELQHGKPYRFRVQVRTCEGGVGPWSEPQEAVRAAPDFRWHDTWRNFKIELCRHKLEAGWVRGGSHNFWATFAGDKLYQKGKPHYLEIEILDLGKSTKSLKKLAFGIIACKKSHANALPWQDGKHPIGQWEVPSWAFQPMLGVVNSHKTPEDGVQYNSEASLQPGDRLGMLIDLDEGTISYFMNGRDLGVAFEEIEEESVLPCVSVRDKIRVLLRFPPPPWKKRKIKFTKLTSIGHSMGH